MKHHQRDLDRAVEVIRLATTREVAQTFPAPSPKDGVRVRTVRTAQLELTLARVRRLLAAAEVAAAHDGYSASTPLNGNPGGGKGGGRTMAVRFSEAGRLEVDLLPTSSTETAAIEPHRPEPDPVARGAARVNRIVLQVAGLLGELDRVLDGVDRVQSPSKLPDPPMCWVAQVRYQLPFDDEWDVKESTPGAHTTDFAGQLDPPLDEPRRVCRFVYRFVHNNKRLPTRDEMLAHLGRGVARMAVRRG